MLFTHLSLLVSSVRPETVVTTVPSTVLGTSRVQVNGECVCSLCFSGTLAEPIPVPGLQGVAMGVFMSKCAVHAYEHAHTWGLRERMVRVATK